MEQTKNTLALIIGRRIYREQDSLITIYSPLFGKLNLVARGTQKLSSKLAAHTEPLILADIMIINGRAHDYIGSAVTREAYFNIRADLNKLYYAGQAFNLFNRLVKGGEADKALFFLLINWLKVLDGFKNAGVEANDSLKFSPEEGELMLNFFILKFLQILGYQPEMYKCLNCAKDISSGKNYFSFTQGGIICGDCFLKNSFQSANQVALLTITDDCVKIIRYVNKHDLSSSLKLKVSHKLNRELSKLLDRFIEFCS